MFVCVYCVSNGRPNVLKNLHEHLQTTIYTCPTKVTADFRDSLVFTSTFSIFLLCFNRFSIFVFHKSLQVASSV